MKKFYLSVTVWVMVGLTACTSQTKSNEQIPGVAKTENTMKNVVSIIEIPASDFPRAVAFYQTILNLVIQEVDMAGTQMGVLPNEAGTVNVVLVKGSDYNPTTEGAVIYLNAGSDLQPMLDKVAQNGGTVILPKTEISPEMGFFALFIDTEGNKLGLHSSN